MTMFLIGAVIGAFVASAFFLGTFKIHTKEAWQEHVVETRALWRGVDKLTAENANLRVALSASEMTEEGKKVAAMTMEALDGVIASKQPVR